MPGIVSQADTYIKRVVNTHLQETGSLPSWLISELKGSFLRLNFQSVRRVNPAKWQIRLFDAPCILTGEVDAIWEFPDGAGSLPITRWLQGHRPKSAPCHSIKLN